MKTKYIIALAAGALALAGCQREELAEPGVLPGKDGVVTFAPSVSGIDSEFKSGVSESGKRSLTLTSKDGSFNLPMSCSASTFEGGALTKATLINETGGITAAKFAEAIDGTFWVAAWDKPASGDPAPIIPDATAKAFTGGYVSTNKEYQMVKYRAKDVTGASLATPYWMTMQPMGELNPGVTAIGPADDEYIWKKAETKTFYAYANVPSDATVALIEKAGGQTMTCTGIPKKDVLMGYYQGEGKTGTGDAAKPTGTASIQFHHPLAAVKVKTGTLAEGVTISSVAIEKVYGAGELKVKHVVDKFTWTRGDGAEFKDENLVESIALTCDGEAEFVIPQTVPSKARIRVTLKEDGVPFNVYSPLSGITWKADTVYTYTIGYSYGLLLDCKIVRELQNNVLRNLSVKNIGDSPTFYRLSISANYVNEDGDIYAAADLASGIAELNTDDWAEHGGFYYYKKPLAPGATSEPLFSSYTPVLETDLSLKMDVVAQGVKSDSGAESAKSAWGADIPVETGDED